MITDNRIRSIAIVPLADLLPLDSVRSQLQRLLKLIRETADAMPTHEEFIARLTQAQR